MIPVLYDSTERNFQNNIICRLGECAECTVTEELNNIYECEFKYPVWGKYFSEIQEGRYIGATHDDKGDIQPFEIYKRSAPIDGMVTFYAHHLSYQMSRVILSPIDGNSTTGLFSAIPSHCLNACLFDFVTTRGGNEQFETTVPTSLRTTLMAKKNSILSTYGGELTFNRWTVTLQTNRGIKTDVTIRYGKNMTGMEQTIDTENLYNAIVPYWSGKIEGVDILVTPEGNSIVALESATEIKPVVKDFSSDFGEAPEPEELVAKALEYLNKERPDLPKENLKVSFVQLWQTEEYKNVAVLQRIGMGDKVSVIYPELGVVAENVEVIKTVYNVLLDRYDSMELGQPKEDYLSNVQEKIKEELQERVELGWTVFEERWRLALERAMYAALHPGPSYVVFYKGDLQADGSLENIEYGTGAMPDANGILILDHPATEAALAQKVLMLNMSGIFYSDHGVSGPFSKAWNMTNGELTTEFMNTIRLDVLQIRLHGLLSVHENPQAVYVNGVLQDPIGGYLGYGRGSIGPGANDYTDGIMLSSTNNLDGTQVNNRFVIATTAGTRMQAGNQTFYLLYDTVNGQAAGNAVLKIGGNYVINTGGNIQIVKGNTTHDAYTGSAGANYEVQIGNANLRIVNGIVVNATEWTAQAYQNEIDAILDIIQDVEDDVSGHESRIAGNEQGISNLTSALSALTSRVSTLENTSRTAVFG